jgi:class 3 adenylate cyclase
VRDWPEAPEPPGKSLTCAFEGTVRSIYATLAVRLAHSGLFELDRELLWRNAAAYRARAGGRCGIYLREFADAHGELTVLFSEDVGKETRFQFEEYVEAHVMGRALRETVTVTQSFACARCRTPVPDAYVQGRRAKGLDWIECGACGARVELAVRLAGAYPSAVARMDEAADQRREFAAGLTQATGEAQSRGFQSWVGGADATLAVVFTDLVGSTALASKVGDGAMSDILQKHFDKARTLVGNHGGRLVKTLGDGCLAAFRSAVAALDFALALQSDPGHPAVLVRAGIHVGPVQIRAGDTFGGTVNLAARVRGMAKGAEIWLSDRAKQDVDQYKAASHRELEWHKHEGCELKGHPGTQPLWSVVAPGLVAGPPDEPRP